MEGSRINRSEIATFGAGCFWGVEKAFAKLSGVIKTTVGYSGGKDLPGGKPPTYDQVCSGKTGHAEVVEIEFDPAMISYSELLNVFWKSHDPTTLNRQGVDVGEQYRSAIFFHNPEQEIDALASMERQKNEDDHSGEIVTQIEPAGKFYRAEEYHQKYFEKNADGGCYIGK